MPKYTYRCDSCDDFFDVVHGMTEEQDVCELCGDSNNLVRVPQILNIRRNTSSISSEPVGSHVKQAIKDNEKILKRQKKEATSWDWEKDV